jgi:dienelactone hydrolase
MSEVASMTEVVESIEHTLAVWRRRSLWALAVLLLLAGAAAAAGMIWYHRFTNHVTPQEISHEVLHTTFEAPVRGNSPINFQLYQQANARAQPLVVFTSGDGAWSPFCADVAAHIAATGRTVVGFNAKEYLTTFATSQKPVTPEELTHDYVEIIDAALARPGVDAKAKVTLAGWSLGAGYSVLVSSDNVLKTRVSRVVAISLPNYNELAWKPTDSIIYITHGTPREKVFQAQDYLPRLTPLPLVMLNATNDDTSPLADAQALFNKATDPRRFFTVTADGHHFEGGEKEFYKDLDESFASEQS